MKDPQLSDAAAAPISLSLRTPWVSSSLTRNGRVVEVDKSTRGTASGCESPKLLGRVVVLDVDALQYVARDEIVHRGATAPEQQPHEAGACYNRADSAEEHSP